MIKFNPYLNFDGTTEAAFNFYKAVFGGEFMGGIRRFKDAGHEQLPETDKEKVMHVALKINDDTVLMGNDILRTLGHSLTTGNNFYISINTDSKSEADRIFQELARGGKIEMPIDDTFWGSYFGMVRDKFGIGWMVSFQKV